MIVGSNLNGNAIYVGSSDTVTDTSEAIKGKVYIKGYVSDSV